MKKIAISLIMIVAASNQNVSAISFGSLKNIGRIPAQTIVPSIVSFKIRDSLRQFPTHVQPSVVELLKENKGCLDKAAKYRTQRPFLPLAVTSFFTACSTITEDPYVYFSYAIENPNPLATSSMLIALGYAIASKYQEFKNTAKLNTALEYLPTPHGIHSLTPEADLFVKTLEDEMRLKKGFSHVCNDLAKKLSKTRIAS